MATKRKARSGRSDNNPIDFSEPYPLELIGTQDDPCFGKLHDPRDPVCMKCGDSELCLIAMGQNNHQLRLEKEKESALKEYTPEPDTPNYKVMLIKILRKRKGQWLKREDLADELVEDSYISHEEAMQLVNKYYRALKKKKKIVGNKAKTKLKWKT